MKWKKFITIAIIGMMVLSACAAAGATTGETVAPTEGRATTMPETGTPIPSKGNPSPTPVNTETIVNQVEFHVVGAKF